MSEGSTYKRGNVFWITYSHKGRRVRESSHSANETDARRLLRKRLGEIAEGKTPTFYYDKVTFKELAADLREDYKVNQRKSARRLENSLAHLEQEFGDSRAVDITTARITRYIAKRLEAGAAHATINRELAALRRALNLGRVSDKVARVPHMPMLTERNTRQGFFEEEQFRALIGELPEYLKAPVTFAYYTGMRRGEVLRLTWERVDLKEGCVRLEASDTKSGHARSIYLPGEVLEALRDAHAVRRLDCQLVFHNAGKPIGDTRWSWNAACKRAGCPGLLFHDLRRTAVRNMVRAGISERVAMRISGHRTRSVFDRYDVTSERDLKEAAEAMGDYLQTQNGHNFGHSQQILPGITRLSGDKTPGR